MTGTVRIRDLARADGGHSSETWLIDALHDGRPARWVLRIEPRGHQIYEDASIERQYRMARTLRAHSDLPVPAALLFEPDDSVIGAPFYIMERVEGTAPPGSYHAEGILADSAPAAREALWLESVALLAKLHALDTGPFAFLGYGDANAAADGVTQELARWDSYLRWTRLSQSPLLDRARLWLEDHRPAAKGLGLAWGDARVGNMLYADRRCTAMLDCETASLGGAETDLGWWIFYDEMMTDGVGVPRLPGIGDRAATIAAWEHFAGRRADAMEWHILFGAYRFALISEYAVALAVAAGRYPASAAQQGNPAVRRLEQLLAVA